MSRAEIAAETLRAAEEARRHLLVIVGGVALPEAGQLAMVECERELMRLERLARETGEQASGS